MVVRGFVKKMSDIYACSVFWIDTYFASLRTANPELEKIYVHYNNGEFNSERSHAFLLKNGIYSVLVCLCAPPHNGIFECVWAKVDVSCCCASLGAGRRGILAGSFGCAVFSNNKMSCANLTMYPKCSVLEELMDLLPRVEPFSKPF